MWQALIPIATSLIGEASKKAQATPVDRRMDSLGQDPGAILKQGKAQLSQADAQTREALSPVLDEAIKKSTEQKMQQKGGYGGSLG